MLKQGIIDNIVLGRSYKLKDGKMLGTKFRIRTSAGLEKGILHQCQSKIKYYNDTTKKSERTTWDMLQVWLEVGTSAAVRYCASVLAKRKVNSTPAGSPVRYY